MAKKFKDIFQFFVGIATIISCGVAIFGVTQVVRLVVEVQPAMKEIQRLIDTVVVYQNVFRRDTVVIRENVVQSDTVFVYQGVPERGSIDNRISPKAETKPGDPKKNVSDQEKDMIKQREADYREKIRQMFNRNK